MIKAPLRYSLRRWTVFTRSAVVLPPLLAPTGPYAKDPLTSQKRNSHAMATNGANGTLGAETHVAGRHDSVADQQRRSQNQLPKKLIVCCDGTWMNSDNGWVPGKWGKPGHLQTPTNVTRIARAISSEDENHHPQIVYYQAGIGTGIGLYNHVVGGVSGMGLSENVREAYSFLASNYSSQGALVESDSIFLVGFSRGAYTARSLGGFICALGILKKVAMPHFYEIFMDWENAGDKHYRPMFFDRYFEHHADVKKVKPDDALARDKDRRDEYLKKYLRLLLDLNLTQAVDIKCIGVWDTVGALGIPVNPVIQRVLPFLPSFIREAKWFDTRLDNHIQNAYQALALDERRFPYSPAVWELDEDCTTNMKQVWFPGAHSNIGGSYADTGTADITLAWMMDQLAGHSRPSNQEFQHHDWIKFDDEYVIHSADCETAWNKAHTPAQYEGWGRGKVYDSLTFPQSLAGARRRQPGRYHKTFYETGNTDYAHLLKNTHEYIHSSVRVRIDLGGRAAEADSENTFPKGMNFLPLFKNLWRFVSRQGPAVYQPQRKGGPLEGWKLEDGHESHLKPNMAIDMTADGLTQIRWKWDGKERVEEEFLEEDRLGPFERELLMRDPVLCEKMEFTNNGWRMVAPLKGPEVKHGKTL